MLEILYFFIPNSYENIKFNSVGLVSIERKTKIIENSYFFDIIEVISNRIYSGYV